MRISQGVIMLAQRVEIMRDHPLQGRTQDILAALKDMGPGWHSRADLAAHFSKNRLNPVEVAALDYLVAVGLIESELHPTSTQHINQWVYRIKA
jgi:hypothetical protein